MVLQKLIDGIDGSCEYPYDMEASTLGLWRDAPQTLSRLYEQTTGRGRFAAAVRCSGEPAEQGGLDIYPTLQHIFSTPTFFPPSKTLF